MALYKFIFFLFAILSSSLAFKVTKNETEITQDGKLRLTCIADAYYDLCRFEHKSKACEFQLTTDERNVTTKNCKDFEERFDFVGNYDKFECAITIDNVTDEGMNII